MNEYDHGDSSSLKSSCCFILEEMIPLSVCNALARVIASLLDNRWMHWASSPSRDNDVMEGARVVVTELLDWSSAVWVDAR